MKPTSLFLNAPSPQRRRGRGENAEKKKEGEKGRSGGGDKERRGSIPLDPLSPCLLVSLLLCDSSASSCLLVSLPLCDSSASSCLLVSLPLCGEAIFRKTPFGYSGVSISSVYSPLSLK